MMPIGPAPVMSTSSPTRLNDKAVCVALPKGSKIDARSSEISSGILNALKAGITRYSAKAPSRLTPTPIVFRHRCRRPARQLRQNPQAICPSPETRSPILNPRTSWPISTIRPTYSWPTCMGTGMVFCAHSAHFQMCTSVPQMAVLRTRIRTSLWPTSGLFTWTSFTPGPGVTLASAFIVSSIPMHPSVNGAQRVAKVLRIPMHALSHRATLFAIQKFERLDCRCSDARWHGVGKKIRARALTQQLHDFLSARSIASCRAAQRLTQRAGDDVHAIFDITIFRRAAAAVSDKTHRVRVINHHQGTVPVRKRANRAQIGNDAIHGKNAVGGDQLETRTCRVGLL